MNQSARTSSGGPSLSLAITTGDDEAMDAGLWSGRGVWSSLMSASYAACGPNLCGGRSRIRRRRKRRHRVGPGTYHPSVIRRLLTRYRRGNPVQSIWLGALLASPVWVNSLIYRPSSSAGTLLLLGGSLAGGYVIARVFLGSVSADLEEVRAQNLWLQERAQRANEAFAAHPISVAVSDEEFAAIVEVELAALPPWIGRAITQRNVAITVEEERAGEPRVFGVYQSQTRGSDVMSEITLYRRPIMRVSGDRAALHRQIHDTLLHELGHMFGMSETDLDHFTIGNNPRPDAEPVHPPPTDPR
jgi:predicted Zn-dependent protease with MMP-like domain